jgi:fused signal recognition particle receptor
VDPIVIIVAVIVLVAAAVLVAVVVARRGTTRATGVGAVDATDVVVDRRLRDRLARSRTALGASLAGILGGGGGLGDETWQELEDALVLADVGPHAASEVVASVRARHPASGDEARLLLENALVDELDRDDRELTLGSRPSVVVVVGVNGTGKTTSIAKIAHRCVSADMSVVLGAADTFRAAADAQLRTWGERVGVPVVSASGGADPASVAFDALRRADDGDADVVIIDTAGRLHSQVNLMDELRKIVRVLEREAGGIDEILLVLDGTVGQNGIAQAKAFTDAVGVTGIVLTKLDGTAKGGVAIAVERELGVPVKLIGVGEGMEDLIPFVPVDFVRALVSE